MPSMVLRSHREIVEARETLEARGVSCLGMEFGRRTLWQSLRRVAPARLGDALKSWDVLRTLEFLQEGYPRTARVLDIGAFSSEILAVLHRAGFERLQGIDLNPLVIEMPFADSIRYTVGDFLHTPFADGSFDIVTAMSVIEHGFDGTRLLAELARLIAPGGSFVASVDYWPEKIDTRGTSFFGMDWRIFSRQEIEDFVKDAGAHGFSLAGTSQLDGDERPIHCAGKDYTFAWMALRRS